MASRTCRLTAKDGIGSRPLRSYRVREYLFLHFFRVKGKIKDVYTPQQGWRGGHLFFQGPQPVGLPLGYYLCDAWSVQHQIYTLTFSTAEHHRPLPLDSAKLCCLMTEAHECERN